MSRINVIIESDMYLKIIKVKTKMQQNNPSKNITFTDAVKSILKKGLG